MPRPLRYIGIDPGQSGGIAVLAKNSFDLQTEVEYLRAMPATERDIWELLDAVPIGYCFIEKVHSRPGQSSVATFKFGQNYGFIRGCLIAAEIPFEEITPNTWIKGLGIPKKKPTETKTQWKNRLKAKAQQLYPQLNITLKTADALLIAEYCRRMSAT